MDEKTLRNFKLALSQLVIFCQTPAHSDRDRAGIIQAFEFTYEQAWKTIQKLALANGFVANSPKQAFSIAVQMGLIQPDKESIWLMVLSDRNQTTHTYHREMAEEISQRIQNSYLPEFQALLKAMVAG